MIHYGRQNITEEEISAVTQVLTSDFITQGPKVAEFEQALQQQLGVGFAVALCNGTAALHVACCALDLGDGDYLWTTPNSFVASANCGLYCGAQVDFVDIDIDTRNMSIVGLECKLEQAALLKKLPKVVVVVHFAGVSCDMKEITRLAQKYQFYVVEDCAHAIGGYYDNHAIGACQYSDIAIFSFHPVKNITTGEGGAVCTNRQELHKKIRLLVSHGIVRDKEYLIQKEKDFWFYEQRMLGFNYRLTDIQAAIGIVQLRRLKEFVERRRYLVSRYNQFLEAQAVILPRELNGSVTAWHLYVIELESEIVRDRVMNTLFSKGIVCNVHYIPIHMQPFYQNIGFNKGDFPNAEQYYKRALTMPLYPALTDSQQDFIIQSLCEAL